MSDREEMIIANMEFVLEETQIELKNTKSFAVEMAQHIIKIDSLFPCDSRMIVKCEKFLEKNK